MIQAIIMNRIFHWNNNKAKTLLLRCLCVYRSIVPFWAINNFAQTLETATKLIDHQRTYSISSIQFFRTTLAQSEMILTHIRFTLPNKKAHINFKNKTQLNTRKDETNGNLSIYEISNELKIALHIIHTTPKQTQTEIGLNEFGQ